MYSSFFFLRISPSIENEEVTNSATLGRGYRYRHARWSVVRYNYRALINIVYRSVTRCPPRPRLLPPFIIIIIIMPYYCTRNIRRLFLGSNCRRLDDRSYSHFAVASNPPTELNAIAQENFPIENFIITILNSLRQDASLSFIIYI